MGRGQEGYEKQKKVEEEEPCHTGTRDANLFTARMRYAGSQGICGDGWEGD